MSDPAPDAKPETATPPAGSAAETPAAPAAGSDAAAEAAPEKKKGLKRFIVPALAFLAFATATGLFGIVAKKHPKDADPIHETVEPESKPVAVDPDLSADELVLLSDSYIKKGDFDHAEELLIEARDRADSADIDLRIKILDGLSLTAKLLEKENASREHRAAADALRGGLGPTLPLYLRGESLMAQGNWAEARRAFGRFLLLSRELNEEGRQYVRRARLHLATIGEKEAGALEPERELLTVEPENYFVR